MSPRTRQGYFSQRKQLAFALQLQVQCGDNLAIGFRFRPSGTFQELCSLPSGWRRDENGHFYIWTRNTDMPNVPSETDQHGIRYAASGFIVRVPAADFPVGIGDEDWLNCEVWYRPGDLKDFGKFFVRNPPMIDRGNRLTMNIADEQAVYDDSPGQGGGKVNRNYRRPLR